MTAIRRIGILRTQSLVGCVFVHHRIHRSGGNAKEEAGTSEFLEITKIAMPIGLRNDSHLQPFCLKNATDDRRGKRGVVNVGVGGEEDDIERVPAEAFKFFFRCGEEGHRH